MRSKSGLPPGYFVPDEEPISAAEIAAAAAVIVEQARPLFAGRHPAIQGSALADLVAIWLAGHPAELRDKLIELHVATTRALVDPNVAELKARPKPRGDA